MKEGGRSGATSDETPAIPEEVAAEAKAEVASMLPYSAEVVVIREADGADDTAGAGSSFDAHVRQKQERLLKEVLPTWSPQQVPSRHDGGTAMQRTATSESNSPLHAGAAATTATDGAVKPPNPSVVPATISMSNAVSRLAKGGRAAATSTSKDATKALSKIRNRVKQAVARARSRIDDRTAAATAAAFHADCAAEGTNVARQLVQQIPGGYTQVLDSFEAELNVQIGKMLLVHVADDPQRPSKPASKSGARRAQRGDPAARGKDGTADLRELITTGYIDKKRCSWVTGPKSWSRVVQNVKDDAGGREDRRIQALLGRLRERAEAFMRVESFDAGKPDSASTVDGRQSDGAQVSTTSLRFRRELAARAFADAAIVPHVLLELGSRPDEKVSAEVIFEFAPFLLALAINPTTSLGTVKHSLAVLSHLVGPGLYDAALISAGLLTCTLSMMRSTEERGARGSGAPPATDAAAPATSSDKPTLKQTESDNVHGIYGLDVAALAALIVARIASHEAGRSLLCARANVGTSVEVMLQLLVIESTTLESTRYSLHALLHCVAEVNERAIDPEGEKLWVHTLGKDNFLGHSSSQVVEELKPDSVHGLRAFQGIVSAPDAPAEVLMCVAMISARVALCPHGRRLLGHTSAFMMLSELCERCNERLVKLDVSSTAMERLMRQTSPKRPGARSKWLVGAAQAAESSRDLLNGKGVDVEHSGVVALIKAQVHAAFALWVCHAQLGELAMSGVIEKPRMVAKRSSETEISHGSGFTAGEIEESERAERTLLFKMARSDSDGLARSGIGIIAGLARQRSACSALLAAGVLPLIINRLQRTELSATNPLVDVSASAIVSLVSGATVEERKIMRSCGIENLIARVTHAYMLIAREEANSASPFAVEMSRMKEHWTQSLQQRKETDHLRAPVAIRVLRNVAAALMWLYAEGPPPEDADSASTLLELCAVADLGVLNFACLAMWRHSSWGAGYRRSLVAASALTSLLSTIRVVASRLVPPETEVRRRTGDASLAVRSALPARRSSVTVADAWARCLEAEARGSPSSALRVESAAFAALWALIYDPRTIRAAMHGHETRDSLLIAIIELCTAAIERASPTREVTCRLAVNVIWTLRDKASPRDSSAVHAALLDADASLPEILAARAVDPHLSTELRLHLCGLVVMLCQRHEQVQQRLAEATPPSSMEGVLGSLMASKGSREIMAWIARMVVEVCRSRESMRALIDVDAVEHLSGALNRAMCSCGSWRGIDNISGLRDCRRFDDELQRVETLKVEFPLLHALLSLSTCRSSHTRFAAREVARVLCHAAFLHDGTDPRAQTAGKVLRNLRGQAAAATVQYREQLAAVARAWTAGSRSPKPDSGLGSGSAPTATLKSTGITTKTELQHPKRGEADATGDESAEVRFLKWCEREDVRDAFNRNETDHSDSSRQQKRTMGITRIRSATELEAALQKATVQTLLSGSVRPQKRVHRRLSGTLRTMPSKQAGNPGVRSTVAATSLSQSRALPISHQDSARPGLSQVLCVASRTRTVPTRSGAPPPETLADVASRVYLSSIWKLGATRLAQRGFVVPDSANVRETKSQLWNPEVMSLSDTTGAAEAQQRRPKTAHASFTAITVKLAPGTNRHQVTFRTRGRAPARVLDEDEDEDDASDSSGATPLTAGATHRAEKQRGKVFVQSQFPVFTDDRATAAVDECGMPHEDRFRADPPGRGEAATMGDRTVASRPCFMSPKRWQAPRSMARSRSGLGRAPRPRSSVRMATFEHTGSGHMCADLPVFTTPDGRSVHYFHLDESHELDLGARCFADYWTVAPPAHLEDIGLAKLPHPPRVALPMAAEIPTPFSPSPPGPIVAAAHTLPVADHACAGWRCILLGCLPDTAHLTFRVFEAVVDEAPVVVEEEEEPWDLSESVFSDRASLCDARDVYDTTRVLDRAFAIDWTRCTERHRFHSVICGAIGQVDDRAEVAAVRRVFRKHYERIGFVHRKYSASLRSDIVSMSVADWYEFADDSHIANAAHRVTSPSGLKIIFNIVNFEEHADTESRIRNSTQRMMRFEFMLALLRVAIGTRVQKTSQPVPGVVAAALEDLMLSVWDHLGGAELERWTPQFFRKNMLYTREMAEKGFGELTDELLKLFKRRASNLPRVRHRRMTIRSWIGLLVDAGLLGRGRLTETTAREVFSLSRMMTLDELKMKDEWSALSSVDFLEAIARAAAVLPIPEGAEEGEFDFAARTRRLARILLEADHFRVI